MPYGEEDAYKAQDILGGVGKYKAPFGEDATQPSSFKMRSGNSPLFKLMGSSPAKQVGVLGAVGGGGGETNFLQQIANMIQGKVGKVTQNPFGQQQQQIQDPVTDAGLTNVASNAAAAGGTGGVPPHGPEAHTAGGGGGMNKNMLFGSTGGSGGIGRNQLSAMFGSDIRLKEKIQRTGVSPSGIPIYEFNYIGDTNRYSGAMAQDLLEMNIDAVSTDVSGYYKVNYNNIDVDMHLIN